LFDENKLREIKERMERWERETVPKTLARMPERRKEFFTHSNIPVKRIYTPLDIKDADYLARLRFSRRVSVHTWRLCHHVQGQILDHAPICGIRNRRADE